MNLNEYKIVARRAFNRTMYMLPLAFLMSGAIRFLFQKEKTALTFIMGVFTIPGLQIMFIFLFILYFLNLFSCIYAPKHQDVYDAERNITQAGEGVGGTAREITDDKEIASLYGICEATDPCPNGHILGLAKQRSKTTIAGKLLVRDEEIMAKKYLSNRNTIIIGSPGTGKSAGAMIPNIINSGNLGHSMVITDPKGELCDITYPYLKSIGYDVKVFNLVYPWASNGWNFMEWLSSLSDSDRDKWVNVISNIMIKNTSDGEGFWDSAVNMLLQALICLLLEVTERVEVEDPYLDEIQKKINEIREERDDCMESAKIPYYNKLIVEQMELRKTYVKNGIEKVKEIIKRIDKTDLSKRARLKEYNENLKKLIHYGADQDVIENYGDLQEMYEPITIYEAKKRVLNFGTCVDMLQLNVEETKDPVEASAIESFNKMSIENKRLQFFYEALFKPPYESKVYVALKQMFSMCDLNKSLAYRHYNGFLKEAPATVRSSCKGGLMIRMAPFNQKDIRKITETNEINLEKLATEKCVVYCIISDQDGALSFISSIFITLAFQILQTYADSQPSRKLPIRAMFYLDEISNVGVIPEFTRKLTTLRSRDIHAVLGVQSYPQLLQRYESEEYCMEIFGACDLMVFCGCGNETMTPKFISELTGEMTVKTEQERETQNRFSPLPDANIMKGESLTKRALFTPDEIATMDFEENMVIYRGTRPIKVNRHMWFNYPYAKKLNYLIDKMPRISGSLKPIEKPLNVAKLFNSSPEPTVTKPPIATPVAEPEPNPITKEPVETAEKQGTEKKPIAPKKEEELERQKKQGQQEIEKSKVITDIQEQIEDNALLHDEREVELPFDLEDLCTDIGEPPIFSLSFSQVERKTEPVSEVAIDVTEKEEETLIKENNDQPNTIDNAATEMLPKESDTQEIKIKKLKKSNISDM